MTPPTNAPIDIMIESKLIISISSMSPKVMIPINKPIKKCKEVVVFD